ncbi:hypothetical protein M3P05_13265 [Sansalvadorimonas sp. 2012CJ34-2]|uniref:Uncharacterized protein n=1 Tax=Parendozoicomonas callyspongiae TaxID=2942213 RepID=A0ABT0PHT0_9GAMM|nr:hypothetical protein [Sansalvadorimonas sp. 2012CJ34-2]MCL6270893.1 hypothetical protein [Sansalvadorimonas sp. 2012CJ34-2]
MRRKAIWLLVFLLACSLLFGIPALLLMSWSWRIGEMDQWGDLARFVLMILLPVVPLVFWYSRQ